MKMCRRESRCKKKEIQLSFIQPFFLSVKKIFLSLRPIYNNIMSYLIKVLNNFIINGKLKERSSY